MRRTSIVIDDELMSMIEGKYGKRDYINLSAIMRDLAKRALKTEIGGQND